MSGTEAPRRKVTIGDLRSMKVRGEPIVAMGVYDSVLASLADEAGVHILMTGPSGPMSLFGHLSPSHITADEQLVTLKAVTRVARYALINAHLPYLSYHASPRDAVLSAARMISEGHADTVKCDANRKLAGSIRAIVDAGIPVIAHIGLQASRKVEQSGYGLKGRTAEEARLIVDDAHALVDAGVFAFVVENVTSDVMAHLTAVLPVPTIGLSSGGRADGVCVISGDAVNYSAFARPRHAGQFVDLRVEIDRGLRAYATQVRDGTYPSQADAPRMDPEEYSKFGSLAARPNGG